MTINHNSTSISKIREYLSNCGYLSEQLIENVALETGDKVPLVAFAHTPHDSRSACIAVVDKITNSESDVVACKSLGAPVVFVRDQNGLQFWKQGADKPRLILPLPLTKISKFFKENKNDLAPESIYRAKTWGRLDENYQLSFVDLGLMPLVEEETGKKLASLIERVVVATKANLGWKDNLSTEQGEWLLKSNFWLLAAKILKDKRVPKFTNLNLEDLESVFARVADHYGSDKPIEIKSQRREKALLESAKEIARFSNLSLVSTEALSYLYENALITKETRIALGTHSTPSYLVDYIVGKLRPWIEEMPEDERSVFEPTCGHSAFLVAAMRLLGDLLSESEYAPKERHNYFKKMLRGADIDLFALELARLNLTIADVPNPNGWKLTCANIFDENLLARYSSEASVILANPPFNDFKKEERENHSSGKLKHINKASEVLWQVVTNMKPNSIFGFVLPQGVLRSKGDKKLRKFIAENFEISEICLFPDKVFTFSDTESSVILGRRLPQEQKNQSKVLYRRVREKGITDFKKSYEVSQENEINSSELSLSDDLSFFVPELKEVWNFCKHYQKFESITDIGQGFSFLSEKNPCFPEGAITKSPIPMPQKNLVKGFAKMRESLQTHLLPDTWWLNLDPSVIDRPRWGNVAKTPQLLINHIRVSRTPWRLKAFIDWKGLPFTGNFSAVRPKNDKWSLEMLWAICNSPIANAYSYAFSTTRHVTVGIMRKMPIPKIEAKDIAKLTKLVRAYFKVTNEHEESVLKSLNDADKLRVLHWRIDAEVLRLYGLPVRLERQLLDLFSGVKRRGVPFEQTEYFPKDFKEEITLSELLAITEDWDKTNERRAELIIKDVDENISPEEKKEFDNLQRLADARMRLIAPLPFKELEELIERSKRISYE